MSKKILGLDLGDRHIGAAILDTGVPVSLPLPALSANRFFMKRLKELLKEHEAEEIVIGLPLTLAGTDSPQTKKVRSQALEISESLGVPVHLEDERFTSHQAGELLGNPANHAPHHLDSVAAQLILEAWWARQIS